MYKKSEDHELCLNIFKIETLHEWKQFCYHVNKQKFPVRKLFDYW